MTVSKSDQLRPRDDHNSEQTGAGREHRLRSGADRGRDQAGWEAYRKWLSTVSGRETRNRTPIDDSVYSWKGYKNWTDKVKQSWKPDEN
jgi:hypothetical protein